MSNIEPKNLIIGNQVEDFCRKYSIPLDHFFEIINDQKVVPMLRGKGMEYNAFLAIHKMLNPNEWTVHKLNPNPQPGTPDQDISVIHRRSNIRLGIESKSAVRGSMTIGSRARLLKNVPHFKVKSHRSRSNIQLAGTSNDRYRIDAFDVIVTTPANAIFKGATISDSLEMLDNQVLIQTLYEHYTVANNQELLKAADADWRFVLPHEIGDANGFIPRTPFVQLADDAHWLPLSQLQTKLEEVVTQRWQKRNKSPRS